MRNILAIDQGTTSSRAILFDKKLHPLHISQQEFTQHFPHSGWVEHNAMEIWKTTLATCREVIAKGGLPKTIGITNQRETVVIWEKSTGKPIHNAIVWQDRRSASICTMLKNNGHEPMVSAKTGLLLDPYFSATKAAWILDNTPGARAAANRGELLFGTIDTWLIWLLTAGKSHLTDTTNASRTLMYNIHSNVWDDDLLTLFDIPKAMLPRVCDCADDFGTTDPTLFGAAIPIGGVAGDQQAATIGQACFEPGMMKSTYGTGCFALLNTGFRPVTSHHRLLTTIAYRLNGKTTYALEGSIFIAGAVVQWLRDGIKIIENADQSQTLAQQADPEQRLYLVPAFTGLGAPYWDAEARGAIFGLTRNSGPAEFAKAALESVAYQTRDLLEAMTKDWPENTNNILRVDGGMSKNNWVMQNLADQLCVQVDRPVVTETTAKGAAYLAGYQAGILPSPQEFAAQWKLDRRFIPKGDPIQREKDYQGWQDAVQRTIGKPP